ncbi:FUSC family protein [Vallicoccus soli]|uniref:FUSC family protein n=1 Tax=Vallicoccus soli TaxID=2339232 RepID=A0A3A3YUS9_9ACTN|nr:FUSC family protein [Vallicoccus soli]RJK95271.1 FUSC family protein [Vallicoccus soli]
MPARTPPPPHRRRDAAAALATARRRLERRAARPAPRLRSPGARDAVLTALLVAAKGALAAVVAWLVAVRVFPEPQPYFAPLGALLAVNPTVATSLRQGATWMAGIAAGIGVALGTWALVGHSAVGLGLAILVASLLSGWHRLGPNGFQVPFMALFVLLLGGDDPVGYTLPRLGHGALGVAVGVAVNVLVVPPVLLRPATDVLAQLRREVADLLRGVADDLDGPWPPEQPVEERGEGLEQLVLRARQAVERAGESLRWNPRAPRWRREPRRDAIALEGLERMAVEVRGVATTVHEAAQGEAAPLALEPASRPRLVEVLRGTADVVDRYAVPDASAQDLADVAAARVALRRIAEDAVRDRHEAGSAVLAEAALLVDLDRVLREVDRSARSLVAEERDEPVGARR